MLCFEAETLYGSEDFIGGFDPFVWLGIFIKALYKFHDVSLKVFDANMHTPLKLFAREFGKPALNLVDP